MLQKLQDRFRREGPSRPRSKTEKRRRLVIVLLVVLAVVSSVSVVGYGYYNTNVKPWHEPILKVNGTVFDMRYFVKMMRLYQVSTSDYADYVISTMEENELARQELEGTCGIFIDEDAVDAELRDLLVSDNGTDEEFDGQYDALVTNLKTYGLTVKDIKDLYIKPSLISDALQKQIGDAQYPSADNYEHVQVQALLITGSDNATLIRTRWDNGEAFDTLAEEDSVSTSVEDVDTDNATNWVAKGIRSEAFDSYAFSATLGVISVPLQDSDSSEDCWLIKVMATESRPLSDSDRDTFVSEAYSEWLDEAENSEDNVIVNYLDEGGGTAKLNWALNHVAVSDS
jgi:hypothetical protein